MEGYILTSTLSKPALQGNSICLAIGPFVGIATQQGGHSLQDAEAAAHLGFDGIKVDGCGPADNRGIANREYIYIYIIYYLKADASAADSYKYIYIYTHIYIYTPER